MQLRPQLSAPAGEPQRVAELCAAIDGITRRLERGEAADAAIAAFNADTGHHYVAYDFLAYGGSRSIEDFAIEAARPAWPRAANVTRDELIEIVRRILAVDADTEYYLRLLKANVVHPAVDGLIFHPPPELVDATPEAIIDAALSYRPIAL